MGIGRHRQPTYVRRKRQHRDREEFSEESSLLRDNDASELSDA